ncbi:MAG: VWA domain-containing protein [Deltaproteobacteria bacterium]|nr:MAG: VWA domain-containing protein [Deltaproteobacteria bacterium]
MITFLAAVFVYGCGETRLVGHRTQLDQFVQTGEEVADLFTQAGAAYVDTYKQSGFHQVDSFEQKASSKIDILWVVDNSASMQEEQDNLAANFTSFMSFIDQSLIDYHIGVISTDMMTNPDGSCATPGHCGQLLGNPKIIDRSTPNPQAAFENNVHVGTSGGGFEMGILAAHEALSEPLASGANAGFLRDDASLAVIFVSDEDDHSYGDIIYYTRFFSAFKGVGNERRVITAAIVGPVPDGCSGAGGRAAPGTKYNELVTQLGGTTASICEDFHVTLEQLGLTVAGLSRKFILTREPDPGSVSVRVDEDGDGPGGFTDIPECEPDCANPTKRNWRVDLSEPAVYFEDYVPPPQAKIEIEYSNLSKTFPLSGDGDRTTMKVTVDPDCDGPQTAEEKQENTDWWFDADHRSIVFTGDYVPPMDSCIEISYAALQREFTLSREVANPETLKVEVDEKDGRGWLQVYEDPSNGWIFHAQSNSILFQGSYVPPIGSEIRISYSNLLWIFPLSQVPVPDSLQVTLDPDGDGPQQAQTIPRDDPAGTPGFIYYGPEEQPPYTNSISFEKIDWPPLGSVVSVFYRVAG